MTEGLRCCPSFHACLSIGLPVPSASSTVRVLSSLGSPFPVSLSLPSSSAPQPVSLPPPSFSAALLAPALPFAVSLAPFSGLQLSPGPPSVSVGPVVPSVAVLLSEPAVVYAVPFVSVARGEAAVDDSETDSMRQKSRDRERRRDREKGTDLPL